MLRAARRRARADRGRQGHEGRDRQGRGARRRDSRTRSSRSSSRTPPTPRSTAAPRPRRSGTTRDGEIDIFVAGVGTGGTITGVGQVLKPRKPGAEDRRRRAGGLARCCPAAQPGPAQDPGHRRRLRAGDPRHARSIDEVVTVGNETAFDTARLVARLEGIPVGISSGAALAAAHRGRRRGRRTRARPSSSSSPPSPSAISRRPCSRDSTRAAADLSLDARRRAFGLRRNGRCRR